MNIYYIYGRNFRINNNIYLDVQYVYKQNVKSIILILASKPRTKIAYKPNISFLQGEKKCDTDKADNKLMKIMEEEFAKCK